MTKTLIMTVYHEHEEGVTEEKFVMEVPKEWENEEWPDQVELNEEESRELMAFLDLVRPPAEKPGIVTHPPEFGPQ